MAYKSGGPTTKTKHAGNPTERLLSVRHKLNNEAEVILAEYNYDEIARVREKSYMQEVSKDIVGDLGKDVKDAVGKFDYQKGKIVGKVLNDGSKGYRIDFDKQKGAILIDTSEDQVRRIVDNEIMKNEAIIKNGFLRELSSFMEVLSDYNYPLILDSVYH